MKVNIAAGSDASTCWYPAWGEFWRAMENKKIASGGTHLQMFSSCQSIVWVSLYCLWFCTWCEVSCSLTLWQGFSQQARCWKRPFTNSSTRANQHAKQRDTVTNPQSSIRLTRPPFLLWLIPFNGNFAAPSTYYKFNIPSYFHSSL